MKQFEKIGVYLTGSPADAGALGYAGTIARLAKAKRLVCVYEHNDDDDAPPPDQADLNQAILAQLPESVRPQTEVQMLAGGGVVEVLRSARDSQLDLIVKGRRLPANQLAVVGSRFTRLARKAPCSVLLVPNYVRPHLSRILVPTDFSDHSRMALELSLEMVRSAEALGERPQITLLTVGAVGYGYKKVGLSMRNATQQLIDTANGRLEEFLHGVDTSGIDVECIAMCAEDDAEAIHELGVARKVDLIMIGSRGLTASAAALLGSTTERVLVRTAIPLLVVKRKGETVGLLNALFADA